MLSRFPDPADYGFSTRSIESCEESRAVARSPAPNCGFSTRSIESCEESHLLYFCYRLHTVSVLALSSRVRNPWRGL